MRTIIATMLLVTCASAQAVMDPYLAWRLREASDGELVPVYFVIGERLGSTDWFPRVDRMAMQERREWVIRELRAHAARTQRPLWRLLGARGAQDVRSNWLGNFVCARATAETIRAALSLPSVSEAWSDSQLPQAAYTDDRPTPLYGPLPAFNPGAGPGPTNTRADQVWCLGVDGAGVVIMNADGGINLTHGDLVNRLWTNPGEILNNIDDDGNGYVDDINGWSFTIGNLLINDLGGHGTRTAGILVADGSCSGTIQGQAPGAQVMTGQINGQTQQWDAVQYALIMGADIQTSSFSYKNNLLPLPNYRMHRDVADNALAAGLIRTNSTSNNGLLCNQTSVQRPWNVSAPGNVPSPYIDANQVMVGARSGVLGVGAHALSGSLEPGTPCGPSSWDLGDLLAVVPNYPVANWDAVNHNDYPWNGGVQQGLLKPDLTGPTNVPTTGPGTCGSIPSFGGTSAATPAVAGVLALWKSANPSLKPEDVAMIAHQTAVASGVVSGKENDWGAGRIDARAGLDLALCTHRINGLPAWTIDVSAGTTASVELDAVPNSPAIIGIGGVRLTPVTYGGIVGIGGGAWIFWQGVVPASGDVAVNVQIPASLIGLTAYTQAFIDDQSVTNGLLSSNVVEVRIVP